MSILNGHNDIVRKVTWEPSGSLLVRPSFVALRMLPSDSYFQTSCSADGKIIVWDLTQQEPRQVKLIDGIIPAVKDKEYVAQRYSNSLASSDIKGVARGTSLMIALLSGIHLASISSWHLVLTVLAPFVQMVALVY